MRVFDMALNNLRVLKRSFETSYGKNMNPIIQLVKGFENQAIKADNPNFDFKIEIGHTDRFTFFVGNKNRLCFETNFNNIKIETTEETDEKTSVCFYSFEESKQACEQFKKDYYRLNK